MTLFAPKVGMMQLVRIFTVTLCVVLLSSCSRQTLNPDENTSNASSVATQQVRRANSCSAFENRVWAQTVYDDDRNDNGQLDPDGDGLACEELPLGLAPALWADRIPESAVPVEFVSVTDGDTIVVAIDGRREPVRLVGIDAEEAGGPYRDVECFGPEASAFLKERLAPGDRLAIEKDQEERDRYGRLLRWVWLVRGDGEVYLLNEALVRAGYAERYRNTPNRRYQGQIIDAAAFAQRYAFGLWGACDESRLSLISADPAISPM
jgi:micrococcal nuclease